MLVADRFDWLICAGLLSCLLIIGLLLGSDREQNSSALLIDRALEQQIATQARSDFLLNLYRPVEDFRAAGQSSSALLKLDELQRKYPQEAHGELLRGEILLERGAVKQAIGHYVRAVRFNGDYVDRLSPFSRRADIMQLVKAQLPAFQDRVRSNPQNPALQKILSGLYYLQSRLAGGCE